MTDEDREHCDKFVQACSEGNLAQALDMYLAWPTNKTMINRGFPGWHIGHQIVALLILS